MELHRSINKPGNIFSGCVATVGSFDGVHTGHQSVLRQVKEHAEALHLPSVVLTFEPQPREYFQPSAAPARLSTFREKFRLLASQGIDNLICLRFQESLAKVSAKEFVRKLFIDAMAIKRIIIGDDFRFGKNREGDIETLREMGKQAEFEVLTIEPFLFKGERVSSSSIREALKQYDFKLAETLLGRPYSISGRVGHGDKRGRQLGFPTANIELNRVTAPLLGVYVVYIRGLDNKVYEGVANIGTRPVFGGKKLLLEIHLLDFSKDIYGKQISVEFVRRLRGEHRFASVDELKRQIDQDVKDARMLFRRNGNN